MLLRAIFVMMSIVMSGVCVAAEMPEPILYATFDEADGGISGAAFESVGRAEGAGEFTFVPAILGDGLKTKRAGAYEISLNRSLPRQEGTVAFWFKPYFSSESGGEQGLFVVNSRSDDGHDNWQIQWRGNRTMLFRGGVSGESQVYVRRVEFMDDQWIHLAMNWGPAGLVAYVDGERAGIDETPKLSVQPDNTIYIGAWHDGRRKANGLFDELKVFDRQLSDGVVAELAGGAAGVALGKPLTAEERRGGFSGEVPEASEEHPDRLLHLDFEEFPTELTKVVKPKRGKPEVEQVEGKFGKGVKCKRGGIGVNVSGVFPEKEGSVALWARPDWAPGHEQSKVFFHVATSGPTSHNYHVQTYSGQLSSRAGAMSGDDRAGTSVYSKVLQDWKKGEWYFIVFTWTKDDIKLYIDGELAGKRDEASYPHTPSGNLSIGCWNNGMRSVESTLDEFRLYTRGLTAEEVKQLFVDNKLD